VPMCLLYEAGIFFGRMIQKRRKNAALAGHAE
jgi:Sec-independent protein secretion pathway component TatC